MDLNNATGVGPFALVETNFDGIDPVANDFDTNFFNPGGTDTFEFNGTASNDTIDIGMGDAGGVQFKNTVGGVVVSRFEVFNTAHGNVLGANGSDAFNITPSTVMAFNVTGGLPNPPVLPGDQLNINQSLGALGTALNAISSASGYSGSYTFANRQAVNFSEIETLLPPLSTHFGGAWNNEWLVLKRY